MSRLNTCRFSFFPAPSEANKYKSATSSFFVNRTSFCLSINTSLVLAGGLSAANQVEPFHTSQIAGSSQSPMLLAAIAVLYAFSLGVMVCACDGDMDKKVAAVLPIVAKKLQIKNLHNEWQFQ